MPHNIEIPDYVIERIMAKRGKLEVFDRLMFGTIEIAVSTSAT